jgi:hypothetical protein
MAIEPNAYKGTILNVNPGGIAIVESDHTREQLPFTFDKVIGYGGEEPKRVGLASGARVSFRTTNHRIVEVRVLDVE